MNLENTSAIVTGGASGIGAATARAIAKRGARCVILDRNEELGTAVASEIGGMFVAADVADEQDVQAAVAAASELGPLRALVNAAGIGSAARTIGRDGTPFDLGTFEKVLRVNLTGTFNCIRLAAAAMAATDPVGADGARGAIVNVASVAAFDGQVGQAAYSASKGGVVGMTLPIARDLAAVGIRVNTIAPGLIDTPIYGTGDASEAFKQSLSKDLLFPKRLGSADELASMVVELLTNDYVNAETVRVDGGIRLAPK
jgi:NAD(P)-dependent dehydrogenase (short-subunit alcohol dehydrogenase family)